MRGLLAQCDETWQGVNTPCLFKVAKCFYVLSLTAKQYQATIVSPRGRSPEVNPVNVTSGVEVVLCKD